MGFPLITVMETVSLLKSLGVTSRGFVLNTVKSDGQFKDISPADLNDHIMTVNYQFDHVDKACRAAKEAYLPWAKLSLNDRKNYLLRLKDVFVSYEPEMAKTIARDTGKALWDATTEAKALAAKIDITLNESIKLIQEERIANALPQVDGVIRYRSRGVMAVVGPFNFPAHLPNGHIIPALIAGNTIVYKPSEQTPAVAQLCRTGGVTLLERLFASRTASACALTWCDVPVLARLARKIVESVTIERVLSGGREACPFGMACRDCCFISIHV